MLLNSVLLWELLSLSVELTNGWNWIQICHDVSVSRQWKIDRENLYRRIEREYTTLVAVTMIMVVGWGTFGVGSSCRRFDCMLALRRSHALLIIRHDGLSARACNSKPSHRNVYRNKQFVAKSHVVVGPSSGRINKYKEIAACIHRLITTWSFRRISIEIVAYTVVLSVVR
jgi:hypothetical protein